jgi:hypothetical protein
MRELSEIRWSTEVYFILKKRERIINRNKSNASESNIHNQQRDIVLNSLTEQRGSNISYETEYDVCNKVHRLPKKMWGVKKLTHKRGKGKP